MSRYIKIMLVLALAILLGACSSQESASNNDKIQQTKKSETQSQSSADGENMSDILQSLDQSNTEDTNSQVSTDVSQMDTGQSDPPPHSSLNYNCDIEKDRETFDADHIDIVVGDTYYATQINDWYMNFDEYEGKTVEIEGYYIADYLPYLFVGRFGPTCPYCQGSYVCFEFYTKQDLTELVSDQDWIKVKGILRKDKDENGEFCYIEAVSIEKMDEVGIDTISN